MSTQTKIIFAMLLLGSTCVQASGAELKSSTTKDGRVIVSFSGEIADGDGDAFKAAVKAANVAGKLVTSVRLNSIGGSLAEGVRLAEAIRFGKITTNVGQGATCASACFLVFAAGEKKFANYTARIGVHGASDQSGAETVQSGAATISMARVAKELGVPPSIIGRMVVTPPTEMVWLSPQDLRMMGTSMVGNPAQVATSEPSYPQNQTAPDKPLAITPPAKASTPPTWSSFVDGVASISARQNRGNTKTVRGCQPEFKTCFNAILFKNTEGFEVAVKVVKDMNDRIITKEVCTFNASNDIRRCFDWDTNAVHRDMQNHNGEWVKIADE